MAPHRRHAAIARIVVLAVSMVAIDATAQAPRRVKGTVVDATAAVLPGVTVVAQTSAGRALATTVTNAAGEFVIEGLPPGKITLRFHLNGFADAEMSVTISSDDSGGAGDDRRLVQRMEISGFAETVNVRADPPPPPPRVLAPVPEHDPASICGPAKAEGIVPGFGTIKSLRKSAAKGLFAAGDELLLDAGLLNLLHVGENFVVRRRYATTLVDDRNRVTMGEHSAGVLQIVDVDGSFATAVVIYACDEMMIGDYLAPFVPEPVQPTDPRGTPGFDKAAPLLFGEAHEMLGSTNRLLVIGQGTRHGVRTGQRMTIFRRSFATRTPTVLGEAVVVSVRHESATVRVEHATDVIFLGDRGDWVAPQRPASTRRD